MKAAVLKNNKFTIRLIPRPLLEKYGKGAIIKVSGCGLCGSDIVKIRTGKAKNGDILGHEVVGQIVDINTDTNFQIGDTVALGHHVPCFNCQYCWSGNFSMCRHFKETNITPGGFAEYIYVSEEHLKNTVFPVNIQLSVIAASFMEPLACCLRAVKRAHIKDGSKCLVVGLGSIGILMGQAAKAMGHQVYGCDLLYDRVALSQQYGFEKSFMVLEENMAIEEMMKITKIGFDTVFLTAGAAQSLPLALKVARDGATIVVFSSVKDEEAGIPNNSVYYREITVMGSYSSSPMDLEDAMALIEEGKVDVEGLSTIYPLENINEAIDDTLSNKIMKAYIQL